jgi:hypothetical protein
MSAPKKSLCRLTYAELDELLERSSILEGNQAEAFAEALREVALYGSEPRLQITHAKALLRRMEASTDFQEALILSHIQESLPSFYLSLALRHIFGRGLVVAASKNPNNSVLRRALARLFKLPGFNSCPVLQHCAAELFLAALELTQNPGEGEELLRQLKQLPGMAYCSELQGMAEKGCRIVKRGGRDPIVKIDLNQLMMKPLNKVKRLFGMGDFRMRVVFNGLEKYEQAVVRVPAFTEKAARRAAGRFIADFLKNETGGDSRSAKILDVFPPGSAWESGRHPILNLS